MACQCYKITGEIWLEEVTESNREIGSTPGQVSILHMHKNTSLNYKCVS